LTPIRIATIAGRSEEEASVAAALEVRRDVDLVMRCVDRVGLLACVRARRVDAVVPVGAPQWLDRETAAEAIAAGVKLVGYGGDRLDVEMLQALGARHLSDNASLDDLVAACSEDEDVSLPVTRHVTGSGRIVAVWGPKGAPGRTRVAIEVAAEIAATTERTLLVDADPYGGDVLQLLGVIEELPTVVWAARAAARCDLATTVLPALRRAWDGGPVLLPGLPRADLWPDITAGGWSELLRVVRTHFDRSIFDVGFCIEEGAGAAMDGSRSRNRMARLTLAEADHVVAVCRADAVGIKNFIASFDGLKEVVDLERVVVVVNRANPTHHSEIRDLLRRQTGKQPVALVPDRPTDIAHAEGTGRALRDARPSSPITAEIRSVAARLGTPVPSRGLLARLGGRG